MKIRVKDRVTNELGFIDDSELSERYQPIQQTQISQPQQQPQPQGNLIGNIATGVGKFLAPAAMNIGQDVMAGLKTGDYVSGMQKNTEDLIRSALELRKARQSGGNVATAYQKSRQVSEQAKPTEPQFSTDIAKSKLGRGIRAGTELGTLLTPFLGGISAKVATKLPSVGGLLTKGALDTGLKAGAATGGLLGATGIDQSLEERIKGGVGAATVGAVTGGAFDLGSKVIGGISSLFGKGREAIAQKAVQGFTKSSPAQYRKAIETVGKDINKLSKKYVPPGSNYDDLLGDVSKRGKGGLFKDYMDEAEAIIKGTAKKAGNNVRIIPDKFISALEKEGKIIAKELGPETRKDAIKAMIDQAKNKYKNGATVKNALNTVRTANENFGKNIVDVAPGDAIATAAQKLEANALKRVLKVMFPNIKDALDKQSEILTLRPILNQARAINQTQGSSIRTGQLQAINPLNPFTWGNAVEAAVQKPEIATKMMGLSAGQPAQLNVARPASLLQNLLSGMGGQPQPQQIQQEATRGQQNVGADYIDQSNQIVPQQNYLTGRPPEDHYQAYMRAMQAGDKRAAAQLYSLYEDETKYQKAQKPTGKGNVTSSIDMMEQLYAPGTNQSLSMGKNTVGLAGLTGKAGVEIRKQTDQDYVDKLNSYKTQMALVAGAINQAAGAGVLNGGEYERLAMQSFPNEYTSEKVAKDWFANARRVLESMPADRAEVLQSILNQ